MRAYNAGEALEKRMRSWTLPFLIRHSAYHTLDHAWEMEDKDLSGVSADLSGVIRRRRAGLTHHPPVRRYLGLAVSLAPMSSSTQRCGRYAESAAERHQRRSTTGSSNRVSSSRSRGTKPFRS